jgi:hypothetical protein
VQPRQNNKSRIPPLPTARRSHSPKARRTWARSQAHRLQLEADPVPRRRAHRNEARKRSPRSPRSLPPRRLPRETIRWGNYRTIRSLATGETNWNSFRIAEAEAERELHAARGGSAEQSQQRLFLSSYVRNDLDRVRHVEERTATVFACHGTWGCPTARRMTLNCLKTCLIGLVMISGAFAFAGRKETVDPPRMGIAYDLRRGVNPMSPNLVFASGVLIPQQLAGTLVFQRFGKRLSRCHHSDLE